MLREEHMLGELHAYRYRGDNPQYALVISHGIGAHGGIYDIFCTHHAARGVDIWSYSAPGHGKSTTTRPRGQWNMKEWAEASVAYAEHVKRTTGLPVFTLGSSLGVAAAFSVPPIGRPVRPNEGGMEISSSKWTTRFASATPASTVGRVTARARAALKRRRIETPTNGVTCRSNDTGHPMELRTILQVDRRGLDLVADQ